MKVYVDCSDTATTTAVAEQFVPARVRSRVTVQDAKPLVSVTAVPGDAPVQAAPVTLKLTAWPGTGFPPGPSSTVAVILTRPGLPRFRVVGICVNKYDEMPPEDPPAVAVPIGIVQPTGAQSPFSVLITEALNLTERFWMSLPVEMTLTR